MNKYKSYGEDDLVEELRGVVLASMTDLGNGFKVKFKGYLETPTKYVSFTYPQALQLKDCLEQWAGGSCSEVVKSKISDATTCKAKDTGNGVKVTFKASRSCDQDEIITFDYEQASRLYECLILWNREFE